MDGIQRYIANAGGRPADEIERADPALGRLAIQALISGNTSHSTHLTISESVTI